MGLFSQSTEELRVSPCVCLVTEELAGIGGSGGIGAAFLELAVLLASRGAMVDVLYCPVAPLSDEEMESLQEKFIEKSIKLLFLDETRYVDGQPSYEKRSYAVFQHLEQQGRTYDFIHFHDYKGLGFFSIKAKKLGVAFCSTELVVQLHGPTRWTIEANKAFFTHEDQLKIDFLERQAIADADHVVSPSQYLVDWLKEAGFSLPSPQQVHVIKNVCSGIVQETRRLQPPKRVPGQGITDIVLFARHEDRKGFGIFCDALDELAPTLARRNITVTFMGKLGAVDSQPSGIYLLDRSKNWAFNYKVRTGCDRSAAAAYFATLESPVVVIPSPFENSPYTVLESVAMGLPLICSVSGGGPELLEMGYPGLCEMTGQKLAAKLEEALENGLAPADARESLAEIEKAWLEFHSDPRRRTAPRQLPNRKPRVALAITHHERPTKLVDAVISAARQTYDNLQIIVVDDGSKSQETLDALEQLEPFINRIGGRLIRRENGYLGAARNTALAAAADAEYICFLDDDDFAFPDLIETLVKAALASDADVLNCFNVFMPEAARSDFTARIGQREHRISYTPIGGPLSIGVTENVLGAATALIKTEALRSIDGYTELKGVGHEDFELFIRMLQAGMKLEIVPRPLYFYEVGRPSMLSRTSMVRNFRRCFDASDLASHGDAAQDLLSLTLGKKMTIDAHNRQWWLYSLCPTAELRHRLMSNGSSRTETLIDLIRLSQAEGNVKMTLALAEDLRSVGPASVPVDVELVTSEFPGAGGSLGGWAYDARLSGVKLDLFLGRFEQAMLSLTQYASESRSLTEGFFEMAQQVLRAMKGQSEPTLYRNLSAAIYGKRVPRAMLAELRVLQVVLERAAGSCIPVEVLREVVKADGVAYLALHDDVARAVGEGRLKDGVEHYLSFGAREGRQGFGSTERISELLGKCNIAVEVEELIELACG